MTKQPVWKLVARLGDVNPIEYGGLFVYVDTTGVYPPEAEKLFVPNDEVAPAVKAYEVRRFIIEPCTFTDGILSDNKFHPLHPAWFAKTERQRVERPQDTTYLKNLADFNGCTPDDLILQFIDSNPAIAARAWEIVGDYHGWDNLDSDPLRLTRAEVEARYTDELAALKRGRVEPVKSEPYGV